jgi:uncharacterized protein with GYD domain
MATYIAFGKFTQQGFESMKDAPARVEANLATCRKMGLEIKSWFLTMGKYDLVIIGEAADDATVAKLSLAMAAQGNARYETARAFNLEEFKKIAASLP